MDKTKPETSSGEGAAQRSDNTNAGGQSDKMGILTYVPLALWLVLSNILAFLLLMVVAPRAEDFAEQSLQQKRAEYEHTSTAAVESSLESSNKHAKGDSVSVVQEQTRQHLSAASITSQDAAADNKAIVSSLLEPFVGTMRPLQSLLLLAFIAGYLGGSLHALASLLHYRAHNELTHYWTLWYVGRPLKGAITAVIFSFIIQAGLMTGVSGDSVVNPMGIIALSLLVGMSAHDATNRLGIVFSTFFNTAKNDKELTKTGEVFRDSEGHVVVIYEDGTHRVCRKPQKEEENKGLSS